MLTFCLKTDLVLCMCKVCCVRNKKYVHLLGIQIHSFRNRAGICSLSIKYLSILVAIQGSYFQNNVKRIHACLINKVKFVFVNLELWSGLYGLTEVFYVKNLRLLWRSTIVCVLKYWCHFRVQVHMMWEIPVERHIDYPTQTYYQIQESVVIFSYNMVDGSLYLMWWIFTISKRQLKSFLVNQYVKV